jgi:hypothetical protein
MQLRKAMIKPINKKKRLNFSAMLTSEYFFHRSNQIQMALNRDRILPRDYLIRRAKSKINTGKKRIIKDNNKNTFEDDSFYESNKEKDKKEIPDELGNLLDDYKKKFEVQNIKYKDLKEYNDMISSYWNYINKTNSKKERELLLKRYFSQNDKNAINLYSEKLQKLTLNIFKSNPLLQKKKNADMFFHYLSEFNKYYQNEEKYTYVKQKIIYFLEKLKEFLDFMKIKMDTSLDFISKDIKIKNSQYVQQYEIKVLQELRALKEKQSVENAKEIEECEKMINHTKKTLKALFQNKSLFEDPIYFDPLYLTMNSFSKQRLFLKSRNGDDKNKKIYNNISSSNYLKEINYSPNKTAKMNSTASTGFYIPDKKNMNSDSKETANASKNATKIIELNSTDKVRKFRRAASSLYDEQKRHLFQNKKGPYKSRKSIEMRKKDGKYSLSSIFIGNDNEKNKNIKNNNRSEEENINKIMSNKSISKLGYNIPRRSNLFSYISSNKLRLSKNSSDLNIENKNDKNGVNYIQFKNVQFNYDIGKDPLGIIYEGIKNKQKIKDKDIDKINSYMKKNGKTINYNLRPMDIIHKFKIITNRFDVENKTKKVFHSNLTYEQLKKLQNIRGVNKALNKLDIDYMNHIFDYRSKSGDDIQLFL